MDQERVPVLEALAAYHTSGQTSFTPPGHRQGRGVDPRVLAVLGEAVFRGDVLATGGLDDRKTSGGILAKAEDLTAEAVGARRTFFSTCGSSLSVKSAMLAVAGPHEKLVIGRDAHKSVIAGIIVAGLRPIWVDPSWDAERHLAHPPSAAAIAAALAEHPDARGVLVTSPTPYGTCADLAGIAAACHDHGVPLIVDEAWGAHLPFHPDLPRWAMRSGADVCVTSIHKAGSGLEQGSVFHLQGDLVNADVLASRADLLGTTSPSVLLYAAIDGWRRQMVQHGRDLYGAALDLARTTRERIERIDGLHVHGRDDFCGPGLADDLDPLQLIIDVSRLGTTGYAVADRLREEHEIDAHLSDHRRISAQLTHADSTDDTDRLVKALAAVVADADHLRPAPTVELPSPADLRLEQVLMPRDAFFGRVEQVPVEKAVGRVSAEMVTPYPPGIPAVLPGQRLNREVLRYLRSGVEAGMVLPDPADPTLQTVRVAEGE